MQRVERKTMVGRPFLRSIVLLSMAPTIGLASMSAPAQDVGARSVAVLLDCSRVGDDGERLRCYDRAAAGLAAARTSGELVTLDRSKVVAAKRQAFGLPAPRERPTVAQVADPLAAVREIQGTIVQVRPAEYGRFLIALDKYGVWQNVDPLNFPPSKGETMRVERAGFGGFRATIGKGRAFLVKRAR